MNPNEIADGVANILKESGHGDTSVELWRTALRRELSEGLTRKLNEALTPKSTDLNERGDMTYEQTILSRRQKAEAEIQALHERTVLILGKDDYTDDEYARVLAAVVEASNSGTTLRASEAMSELSEQTRSDAVHAFAEKHLRERGIDPRTATAEQYAEAADVADQVLFDRGV